MSIPTIISPIAKIHSSIFLVIVSGRMKPLLILTFVLKLFVIRFIYIKMYIFD